MSTQSYKAPHLDGGVLRAGEHPFTLLLEAHSDHVVRMAVDARGGSCPGSGHTWRGRDSHMEETEAIPDTMSNNLTDGFPAAAIRCLSGVISSRLT